MIVEPVDTTAEIGGDVSLPCLANTVSSYAWTKNNQSIDVHTDPRMSLIEGSLQIKGLKDGDGGEYACKGLIQKTHQRKTHPATLGLYGRRQCICLK